MKKQNIIIIAFSAILASCSTGNDITSNYFDDGIYFDPTYKIEPYAVQETEEYTDSNVLPDYAYSESFDYYDPNMVSATQPDVSNNGYYGGGSNWGFTPSVNIIFGFGNAFYPSYRNSFYGPYDYGFGGYPGYGYGYGYPGYGYGYPGYGYPGYGYPPYGYGYPIYCPGGSGSGSNNINNWVGNSITSDWSTNKYRTRVNGSKTGSRSSTSAGENVVLGPKKNSGETPGRVVERQYIANSGSNSERTSVVNSRDAKPASSSNVAVSRQSIQKREAITTRSRNAVGVVPTKTGKSKVKTYYANTNKNVTVSRTYSSTQANRVSNSNPNPASTVNRRSTSSNGNLNRVPTRNYYNSATNTKPKSSTRTNSSGTVRSYSPGNSSGYRKPSSSSNYRSSGSSMHSTSPSRSSSSPARSSGSTRTSGGRR